MFEIKVKNYNIDYSRQALDELEQINRSDQYQKRLKKILVDIAKDPYSPAFKMEKLQYNLSGFVSKRLTRENRVVYYVMPDKFAVMIISLLGHYENFKKY